MTRFLHETHHSVRDIARAVGRTNQVHTTEQFCKFTGQIPAEYRAEVRNQAVVQCF